MNSVIDLYKDIFASGWGSYNLLIYIRSLYGQDSGCCASLSYLFHFMVFLLTYGLSLGRLINLIWKAMRTWTIGWRNWTNALKEFSCNGWPKSSKYGALSSMDDGDTRRDLPPIWDLANKWRGDKWVKEEKVSFFTMPFPMRKSSIFLQFGLTKQFSVPGRPYVIETDCAWNPDTEPGYLPRPTDRVCQGDMD